MSNHNSRSRYNPNITTSNNIHDKDRAGVPANIPMLEHIGDSSPVDQDVGYTERQRDIIDKSDDRIYERRQHDVRFDLPDRGYDPIKTAHPLGVTSVNSHGDKGFDYRDYPSNVAQDHDNFDPYIQYLNSKGLIGLNKSRYITNYVNIDSRDRTRLPCTKNSSPIRLGMNPLTFNENILRIDITNVDQNTCNRLTPGTKIIIRGLEEFQYTLRTAVPDNFGNLIESFIFEEGKQYLRVDANNNIDVQTGNIADVKEDYADIKVRFEGFMGDLRTISFYDFSNFIVNTSTNPSDPTQTIFAIRENVYGNILFKVADFVVDQSGLVIEDNTERPYPDVITWNNPNAIITPVSLPPGYFTSVSNQLNNLPVPSIPTTFIEYIRYIEQAQNIIRPQLFAFMNGSGNAFTQQYLDNNDNYDVAIRFVLEELTQSTNTSRIGNIPLNSLNLSHRIFFTATDVEATINGEALTTDIPSGSNFFIQLDRPYQNTPFLFEQPVGSSILQVTTVSNTLSDVLVAFKHYGGVPIRSINAEYPLGPQSDAGFRFVTDVIETNGRKYALVELNRAGYLNRAFGGDCLIFAFVEAEETGFIQPNRYIVEFGRVYYKVAMVRIVSSQFPISQKTFLDGVTGGVRNNRFYWQNLNDGSRIYSIEIEPGDYTSEELEEELERKIANVDRFDEEIPRNIPNIMRFSIDPNTDLVQIASFNFYKAPGEPFILANNLFDINTPGSPENLNPENKYYVFPMGGYFSDFPKFSNSCECYRIKVFYPNHGLKQFDEFVIENAINFGQISEDRINGSHVVTQVIDNDNFDFVIDNVNLIQLPAYTVTGTIDPFNATINGTSTGTVTGNTNGTINANMIGDVATNTCGRFDVDLDIIDLLDINNPTTTQFITTTEAPTTTVTPTTTTTPTTIMTPTTTMVPTTTVAPTTTVTPTTTVAPTTESTRAPCDVRTEINDIDITGVGRLTAENYGTISITGPNTLTATSTGNINIDTEAQISGTAEINANIVTNQSNAKGGFNVVILTPNQFRIRYDQPDTIGTNLGFRSVGLCTSITPYSTVITNETLYEDEDIKDVLGLINPNIDISNIDTSTTAIRDSVVLSGPPYLLITCPELSNVRGRGKVKDIFYKINLRDNSRNVGSNNQSEPLAYDTYADTPIFYNEPLRRLEKLTLEFLTPDGDLYDFNGVDHSFVIEITTFEEIPEATSLQKN